MPDLTSALDRLRARIEAQNGTVLDSVEGVVELDDVDDQGEKRLGPVLVLRSIEEGAQLKLARPRPVTVLGSLSGQVLGAYRVKAGNLLSGRLEGVRHVEIVHNMGSKGTSNADSCIIFEATADPGFFDQAQHGLERLRVLIQAQRPQRESAARSILLRALKDVPYDIRVYVTQNSQREPVFSLRPGGRGTRMKMDLKRLLRYLVSKAERAQTEAGTGTVVDHFNWALETTIAESLRVANSGGMGAALRKQRGDEVYTAQVEVLRDYLQPKLISAWVKTTESYVQRVVDMLSAAPMVLRVDGQLAPFFQIEYPRWHFQVTEGKICPEKVADCNIACQLADDEKSLQMTYTYVREDDRVSQTCQIELDRTRGCQLILKDGNVYLSEESNWLFGPDKDKSAAATA
jgi:hypothetical protein